MLGVILVVTLIVLLGGLEWACVNLPTAVVLSVDKKALAETLLTTGEAVDFARLLPAEEVFYIK